MLENVHPDALAALQEEGFDVDTEPHALTHEQLLARVENIEVLGVRSRTRVSADVLDAAPRLRAIGAFSVGARQVDLRRAAQRGVAVFNAPYSNTRSVVELAIGLMIALVRRITVFDRQMHRGEWNKSAQGVQELRGLTLGIVGYGSVGAQLSVVAEALGLQVVYFDLIDRQAIGTAQRLDSLHELLRRSDVVSVHVDDRDDNRGLIGTDELALLSEHACLINLSRGFVIDDVALARALADRRIGGAALDVFPTEPAGSGEDFRSPLQQLDNVILTPHIGGSTEQAQQAIGSFVADKLISFERSGSTAGAVNLPALTLGRPAPGSNRLTYVHRNRAGAIADLTRVLADHQVNILAQQVNTQMELGYALCDLSPGLSATAFETIDALPATIRTRLITPKEHQ